MKRHIVDVGPALPPAALLAFRESIDQELPPRPPLLVCLPEYLVAASLAAAILAAVIHGIA